MSKITIVLDAMGGDQGCSVIIPAALRALELYPFLHLILVGQKEVLEKQLAKYRFTESLRLTLHHAAEIVAMDEKPAQALRYKKDSSMRVALNLVKEGKAQACVSAGNTGALVATARFVLKMLPGISRPAIIKLLPAESELGHVRILDLGANVDSDAETLFKFAVMGSVMTSSIEGIENPKVALLNNGVEEIKGTEQVRQTARLLVDCPDVNYIGYIEGDGIFKGQADVIVCDGFIGNIALKTIEGVAKFISRIIKDAFRKNLFTRLAAVVAVFVLRPLVKRMDPSLFNGASLLGLKGIVVKSHGSTTVKGFIKAIEVAIAEVEHNVPEQIAHKLASILERQNLQQQSVPK